MPNEELCFCIENSSNFPQPFNQMLILPQPIPHVSSVQYEDTFLLVGGLTSVDWYTDTFYQYMQTSGTWIIREERLSIAKGCFAAALAGRPAAQCNWSNKCRVNDSHLLESATDFFSGDISCNIALVPGHVFMSECESNSVKMPPSNSTQSDDHSGGVVGEEDIETAKSEFRLGIEYLFCAALVYR